MTTDSALPLKGTYYYNCLLFKEERSSVSGRKALCSESSSVSQPSQSQTPFKIVWYKKASTFLTIAQFQVLACKFKIIN